MQFIEKPKKKNNMSYLLIITLCKTLLKYNYFNDIHIGNECLIVHFLQDADCNSRK